MKIKLSNNATKIKITLARSISDGGENIKFRLVRLAPKYRLYTYKL